MLRFFTLSVIWVLSTYSSCHKGGCIEKTYSFVTSIRAYPDTDSVNINDTIWVEVHTPTRLFDLSSGNEVDYSGAVNLGTDINFYQFTGGSVSNPGVIAAVDAFDFKLVLGEFIPDNILPDQNKDYKFLELNGTYKFKLGIIPKRFGIFTFSAGNAANVYRQNDQCVKAGFKITFAGTNQHLYFYEQNRLGYTPSEYERTHMYCFKVK